MINKNEKDYCNYNYNLTGRGLKIALFEYYPSTWFYKLNIDNPLNANWRDINGDNDTLNHPYMTGAILRDMLKDAIITYLPQNDDGVKYAIKNGYHIASFSAMDMRADDSLEKQLAQNTLLMSACGNSGSEGETITARNDWWTSVGGAHLNNNNVDFAWYSSYGFKAVDLLSFSNIQFEENSEYVIGTSFSTPFFVGLLSQFYEAYNMKFGFYPTVLEAKDFIIENSKPILNNPLKEGYGLFTLPKNLLTDYNFGTAIKLNSNEINVNGVIKNTVNPAQIMNNKTMVELTVLRECKGNKVYWNDKVKCAIVK